MISGLYAAATGMMGLDERQTIAANNIANASTPGFRRQEAVQRGFNEVLLKKMANPMFLDIKRGPGGGIRIVETYSDTTGGPIAATGDPLNIALMGPGFLAVDTPQGERYTRNGNLTIDSDGNLATAMGYKVQSSGGGPISVSGGSLTIDSDGKVVLDGTPTAQLRLIEFENPHALTRQGENLYAAGNNARSTEASETQVVPESLEMSNVQLPYEMIRMTLALRAYGANQRIINAIDETMGRLISDVGSPV